MLHQNSLVATYSFTKAMQARFTNYKGVAIMMPKFLDEARFISERMIARGCCSTPDSRRESAGLAPLTMYATATDRDVNRVKMRVLREERHKNGLTSKGTKPKKRWTGGQKITLGTRWPHLHPNADPSEWPEDLRVRELPL